MIHPFYRLFLLTALCFDLASSACVAQSPAKPETYPARLLLIRHAEKPPEEAMSEHLSAAGKKRAEALAELFEKSDERPEPFPKPDFILAAKNSKNSHRPLETVEPLAKKFDLKVNADYHSDDVDGFVKHLFTTPKYAGKVVLVAWRHGSIPALAKKLGATDAPKEWKDDQFASVWDFTFDEKGKITFQDRPQQLMPGDAKK